MTTPDRYPVVGALPDVAFFQQAYADLRYRQRKAEIPAAQYQPGLLTSAGYGSRSFGNQRFVRGIAGSADYQRLARTDAIP